MSAPLSLSGCRHPALQHSSWLYYLKTWQKTWSEVATWEHHTSESTSQYFTDDDCHRRHFISWLWWYSVTRALWFRWYRLKLKGVYEFRLMKRSIVNDTYSWTCRASIFSHQHRNQNSASPSNNASLNLATKINSNDRPKPTHHVCMCILLGQCLM